MYLAIEGEPTYITTCLQEIEVGKYNAVIINPELLMTDGRIAELWKKPKFTSRLLNIILDEGQCASLWNSFRKEYLQLADLRYLIPDRFSFYIPSAMFPPYVVEEVLEVLYLHSKKIEMF
jgi:superfamily II DNA helicase RecQ